MISFKRACVTVMIFAAAVVGTWQQGASRSAQALGQQASLPAGSQPAATSKAGAADVVLTGTVSTVWAEAPESSGGMFNGVAGVKTEIDTGLCVLKVPNADGKPDSRYLLEAPAGTVLSDWRGKMASVTGIIGGRKDMTSERWKGTLSFDGVIAIKSIRQADAQAATVPDVTTAPAASRPAAPPPREITLDLGEKVTLKLVLVPAGKFQMGSAKDEPGRQANEGPQHEVTIGEPFYMGVCAITQEQYQRIAGKNPSNFKGGRNPVEGVAWGDAAEFCKALSQKSGRAVSLPTEAQWEYACRAGSATRFSYGDDEAKLADYAWHGKNSDDKTHPVGQKKPNAWGLYDMTGNVWQWCSDWYADSYANAGKTDPAGPASGSQRVLRGGGWFGEPGLCRSAYRSGNDPAIKSNGVGFRVVVDVK